MGRYLGIIGRDPRVSKSNRSHVNNLQFSLTKLRNFPINSSKWIGNFLDAKNWAVYFSNYTGSPITTGRLAPLIASKLLCWMNGRYEPYGGTPCSIGPWLSHKLCSTVNMTPILSMKAAIDCSHHELHVDIQISFFNDGAISHFRGIIIHF